MCHCVPPGSFPTSRLMGKRAAFRAALGRGSQVIPANPAKPQPPPAIAATTDANPILQPKARQQQCQHEHGPARHFHKPTIQDIRIEKMGPDAGADAKGKPAGRPRVQTINKSLVSGCKPCDVRINAIANEFALKKRNLRNVVVLVPHVRRHDAAAPQPNHVKFSIAAYQARSGIHRVQRVIYVHDLLASNPRPDDQDRHAQRPHAHDGPEPA